MATINKITLPDDSVYDLRASSIPYGECDNTSTATEFTATVPGITALTDGVCVMLKNGIVTSASGFTININNLGAKPVYSNMATGNDITPTNPTRDTTIFNINYTMLLIYSSTIVAGGGWICYRGYDAPATAAPLMDGTAAVGTSAKYAREDHVHPSDTSRQATLVSGTNIKTINGNSVLGSGDLTIGGGAQITTTTVTIAASDWSNNTCTKTVTGVTASNSVIVTYAPASKAVYTAADIYCSAQAANSLTFACDTTPTASVTVNVMIID